jgi:hypothetical protein
MAKHKLNNLEKSPGNNGNCRLNPLANHQVTNGSRRLNNLEKSPGIKWKITSNPRKNFIGVQE